MSFLADYLSYDYLSQNKAPILIAVSVGVISLAALKNFYIKKYKYPIEIDFNNPQIQQHLGKNLNELLEKLEKQPEQVLLLLQKFYPNECSLKLSSNGVSTQCCNNSQQRIIFLNSAESFRRFSKKIGNAEPIANRPQNAILKLISKNYLGSFFRLFDNKQREIRKSSITALHKLSANANEFEAKLIDEVEQFLEFVNTECVGAKSDTGLLQSAPIYLQQISTNIIIQIGINARFPYDNDLNSAVKSQINNISDILTALNLVKMQNLPDANVLKGAPEQKLNSIYDFLTGAINNYRSSYEKEVIQTFADWVISKQSEMTNLNDEDVYSDRDILVQFFTLLMAGAVTTGFTLSWAFYYLAKQPLVQSKLFEELVRTVGDGGLITTKHRNELKYTESCINEILRMSSTQPLTPRATCQEKTTIESYCLPNDTPVLVNMYAISHDPKYWKNSDEFDPKRWMNEKGELIGHFESFMPFGLAPRSCIGDTLSKTILFLVITNVVQRFQLELVPNKMPSESKFGVMRKTPNYDLKLIVRK